MATDTTPASASVEHELGTLLARAVERAVETAVARIEAALRPPPPAHLSQREAARELGISLRTLQRHVRAGDLPASRIKCGGSGRVIIARADLEKLVRKTRL